ncbi:hypothetical protein [Chromobacterium sp.]|uniref:hypothetical protein n=1 Tax=Chromobacterium sp. TaxID=306190 RepID=UPI0035AFD103
MGDLGELIASLRSFKNQSLDERLTALVGELADLLESGRENVARLHVVAENDLFVFDDENSYAESVAKFAWPYFLDGLEKDSGRLLSTSNNAVMRYITWAKKCTGSPNVVFFLNQMVAEWLANKRKNDDEELSSNFESLRVSVSASEGRFDKLAQEHHLAKKEFDSLVVKLQGFLGSANFARFSEGFTDLIASVEERNAAERRRMLWLGLLMLLIPIVGLFLPFWSSDSGWVGYLLHALPLATFELILFYFFRMSLMDWKSTSGQVLQLKNKKSCLQFIETYIDFKKERGDVGLEKFEALIFSGVVADEAKIPSVLDGLDQVVNVLKALKSSK